MKIRTVVLTLVIAGLLLGVAIPSAAPGEPDKPVSIRDLSWLAGRWQGSFFGQGPMEETWLPPLANSMVGTFRAAKDDKVFLYEMLVIEQEGETLRLRMLHFDAGLKGWASEASGPAQWPYRSHGKTKVVFEDEKREFPQRMVYERKGETTLEIRLEGTQQGRPHQVAFTFERAKD